MQVVEQFLKSKTPNEEDCEDCLFISNDFAAVIDGATSKSAHKFDDESSGRISSLLIKNALENLPKNHTAYNSVRFLSDAIMSLYIKHGLSEHLNNYPVERASASVVIFSRCKNEIWMVGDCQCIVDRTHYTNKKYIDELLSNVRSLYLQTEIELGNLSDTPQEFDPGRDFIMPLLKRQYIFQNSHKKSEFSYGAIDGFKVPEDEIKVIKLTKAKSIILASDGYPRLYPTLAQSEKYLNKLVSEDPLFFKEYKTTKGLKKGNVSFDDRAYLRLKK